MTRSASTSPTQVKAPRRSSRVKSTTTSVNVGSETEDEQKVTEPALGPESEIASTEDEQKVTESALDPVSGITTVLPAAEKFKVTGWDLENFGTKFRPHLQDYLTAKKRIGAHWEVLYANLLEVEYIKEDYSEEHERKQVETHKNSIERNEEAEYWERERIKAERHQYNREAKSRNRKDLRDYAQEARDRHWKRKREKYEGKLKAIAQRMGHGWERTADEYKYRIREIICQPANEWMWTKQDMEMHCQHLRLDPFGDVNARLVSYMEKVQDVIEKHGLSQQLKMKGTMKTFIKVIAARISPSDLRQLEDQVMAIEAGDLMQFAKVLREQLERIYQAELPNT
ncbi:hypothetical protein H310_06236 [Aphanomyces invadans]|uniref:Uncharacterized protein n=1 Tax=Aphanomyces invadans TaxID=157072 RepID=A0A024U5A1_9STRA|nr:hypothetical protein H310_06236 [Aphanomyces invadans]ETW01596.1 hypothetical protein H310_06236 [Aphanomyces invadans]|eukprot:XP_008869444.1 hypothetical protein H310_06236 [Aphanomyces invadans]